MASILIVDDEKHYPLILKEVLAEEGGYSSYPASSGMEALDILHQETIDLVLTDVKMPGMDGVELLSKIKELNPDIPVIVMTAHGSVEKAVEAMQKGAYTFIQKPFENDALLSHISKALSIYSIVQENAMLRDAISSTYNFGNIIGKSKSMKQLYETIKKVAPTNANILIEGESGTGKELVAKSIHYNSSRKSNSLIAVNCSAFAESLLESELFGHEKGAFTGATARKKGRFEIADRGTLFLDEVGELPLNLQVKLLRVLQEKSFERVGGTEPVKVDFRLIAATNKNLEKQIEKGLFREDLYYRLNVVKASIPPLRERKEDIPLLVSHFIKKYAIISDTAVEVRGITQEAAKLLFDQQWKGNIRELENAIERAVILSSDEVITPADLPLQIRQNIGLNLDLGGIPENAGLSETLLSVEKRMIQRAMTLASGVQTKAAEILGIGKSGLNQKLKKYGLDK